MAQCARRPPVGQQRRFEIDSRSVEGGEEGVEGGVDLGGGLLVLEANLRGEMKAANGELLRTLFFGMVASNATLVGLVFAAVRLG